MVLLSFKTWHVGEAKNILWQFFGNFVGNILEKGKFYKFFSF